MGERTPPSAEDRAIGQRARLVRKRRGLSLDVAAGLAGITKGYLGKLETGKSRFTRRGLIEDLARALSCSVADLTGQPYPSPDRDTQATQAAIPELAAALHDSTLTDVPDVAARPLEELVTAAAAALAYSDNVELDRAGDGLGALITELHVHAVTGDSDTKRTALAALVEACITARALAGTVGHVDLAVAAARRGYDAARALERPDLIGFMAMGRTMTLGRVGARHRALRVANRVLAELPTGPMGGDTRAVEARGMLHLSAALISARGGASGDAQTHLAEARALAEATGERNALRFHFGPANTHAWELSVAVEDGTGPDAAARFEAAGINPSAFHSRDREASVHLDLARAWAQADGDRDGAVVRALDTADRLAPIRVRSDPIARDLVLALHHRARRKVWELDSLRRRLGVGLRQEGSPAGRQPPAHAPLASRGVRSYHQRRARNCWHLTWRDYPELLAGPLGRQAGAETAAASAGDEPMKGTPVGASSPSGCPPTRSPSPMSRRWPAAARTRRCGTPCASTLVGREAAWPRPATPINGWCSLRCPPPPSLAPSPTATPPPCAAIGSTARPANAWRACARWCGPPDHPTQRASRLSGTRIQHGQPDRTL